MSFIHDDFLLQSKMALRLYHEVARDLPIIDYHCHLPPGDVASDRRFANLFDIWLAGDHYKWRAMRANGVDERFCTGDATPREKFMAWARTVPHTLRNPLYHWSHLELKRYFDIDTLLNEDTAEAIWEQANERLREPSFSACGILHQFKVEVVCTTDDPVDDLVSHAQHAQRGCLTRMLPAFRPDALFRIHEPDFFNNYVDRLGAVADTDVTHLQGLMTALEKRHDFFHAMGCRLSDHGLNRVFARFAEEGTVAAIYDKARQHHEITPDEMEIFSTHILLHTGRLDAQKGWVKQLHLGALRNVNSRGRRELGPDTGFDSIGDESLAHGLARYLDRLESEGQLPKVILYNLNPADNYVLASMIGNFQDGTIPGKMQYGSGWWFLDQREGMTWQLNALSNLGLLSRFVGMLTDSRSFMSYPRHEYFRRLLCDLLGGEVARGELPDDFELLSRLVRDVCHDNAERYFQF